jgi:hypothetical protein
MAVLGGLTGLPKRIASIIPGTPPFKRRMRRAVIAYAWGPLHGIGLIESLDEDTKNRLRRLMTPKVRRAAVGRFW